MPTIVERLSGSLAGDWAGTLTRFRVVDVPAEAEPGRPLLICESPHADEVTDEPLECRYPLRGAAGKIVTKALVACEEPAALGHGREGHRTAPVGQLVKRGHLDSIRIVNVCELPLQSATYARRISRASIRALPEGLAFSEWCQLVLAFRTVRDLRRGTPEIVDLWSITFCRTFAAVSATYDRLETVLRWSVAFAASSLLVPLGPTAPNCSNGVQVCAASFSALCVVCRYGAQGASA